MGVMGRWLQACEYSRFSLLCQDVPSIIAPRIKETQLNSIACLRIVVTQSLSVRRKWFIFVPLIRLTQETRWWGWYISLPRKGCTIGNVKLGRWGGGSPKKKKNLALWLLLKKNIIPFQNVLPPPPSNGASISEISAGTSFLSRLRAPTLVQTFFKTVDRWRRTYRRCEHQESSEGQPNVHSVAVCAYMSRFSARLVFYWLFECFLYFFQKHEKRTNNYSQHLFIVYFCGLVNANCRLGSMQLSF